MLQRAVLCISIASLIFWNCGKEKGLIEFRFRKYTSYIDEITKKNITACRKINFLIQLFKYIYKEGFQSILEHSHPKIDKLSIL